MAGSVILSGARTPIGKLSGSLAGFSGTDLGAIAIKAALDPQGTMNPGRVLSKTPPVPPAPAR